jgi:hypothetical protein
MHGRGQLSLSARAQLDLAFASRFVAFAHGSELLLVSALFTTALHLHVGNHFSTLLFVFICPGAVAPRQYVLHLQTPLSIEWVFQCNTIKRNQAKFFMLEGLSEAKVHGFLAMEVPVFSAAN